MGEHLVRRFFVSFTVVVFPDRSTSATWHAGRDWITAVLDRLRGLADGLVFSTCRKREDHDESKQNTPHEESSNTVRNLPGGYDERR